MGHLTTIECTNCDYTDSFSIGSTRSSHPSGGELKQCPDCDHIEVIWHERYIIELPEPERVATNPVTKFLDWLEDEVLGPEDTFPRRKVVEADTPKNCTKCGAVTKAFDFTCEEGGAAHRYVNATCPCCHSTTLQSDNIPSAMFD